MVAGSQRDLGWGVAAGTQVEAATFCLVVMFAGLMVQTGSEQVEKQYTLLKSINFIYILCVVGTYNIC